MYGGFWIAAILLMAAIVTEYYRPIKAQPAMIFFGNISYSPYLVHFPLRLFIIRLLPENTSHGQNFFIFLMLMLCSILLATFFFYCVEKPGIKLGHQLSTRLKPQHS